MARNRSQNILMIGPTGVGKTEIARRLAELCAAPFVKVEPLSLQKWAMLDAVERDRDLVEQSVDGARRACCS